MNGDPEIISTRNTTPPPYGMVNFAEVNGNTVIRATGVVSTHQVPTLLVSCLTIPFLRNRYDMYRFSYRHNNCC